MAGGELAVYRPPLQLAPHDLQLGLGQAELTLDLGHVRPHLRGLSRVHRPGANRGFESSQLALDMVSQMSKSTCGASRLACS